MEEEALLGHLMALLFVAEEPLPLADAARILGVEEGRLAALVAAQPDRPGLRVLRQADRLELATAPSSARYVERLVGEPPVVRLSRAALETLAIVAYRQPVTRGEIEAIRGLNSDRALATLLRHNLVEEVGRAEGSGRPALFGTTVELLRWLGLASLAELPPLPPEVAGREGPLGAA